MKLKLSRELLGSLPAPDSQGMVRVSATLSVTGDGEATLLEINDMPVGDSDDEDEGPMPEPPEIPDMGAGQPPQY